MISEPLASPPPRWLPPSFPDPYATPVVRVDKRGMVTDPLRPLASPSDDAVTPVSEKRRSLQYVSRHFTTSQGRTRKEMGEVQTRKKRRRLEHNKENEEQESTPLEIDESRRTTSTSQSKHKLQKCSDILTPPARMPTAELAGDDGQSAGCQEVVAAPVEQQSRVFFGLLVDNLSSDSDLTDVPDDIGPDPFIEKTGSKTRSSARKKTTPRSKSTHVKETSPEKKTPKSNLTKSPYFPHAHKPRPTFLSTLPFPPLDLERFGLMQERLCHDPFRLLLATIFLNKTPGSRAMPIFFRLMEQYPTPAKLAQAQQADVTAIIHELGFQNQRARKVIAMAAKWVEQPPVRGIRYRKVDYPKKGDGKDIRADETVDDADQRVAWEISHLPGLGPYSHDSWRMFCRDELRGLSSAYNGENGACSLGEDQDGNDESEPFEPEWKRVLPMDKELRAWMTWMWMKEGYVWNKETGARTKASDELMDLARGKGNVVLEESEKSTLIVKSLEEDRPSPLKLLAQEKKIVKVETPAGEYMPGR